MMPRGSLPGRMAAHLALVLLASCAKAPVSPTSSPIAATVTPRATAVTPAPTSVPPTPTATPLPPPISPEFPTGSFFHEHPGKTFCVFQLNQDGTYAYYWMASSLDVRGLDPFATGTYSIDGTLFIDETTDVPGCLSPASYTWTFDGRNLTFQLVGEDTCSGRQQTYESPLLYTKAP